MDLICVEKPFSTSHGEVVIHEGVVFRGGERAQLRVEPIQCVLPGSGSLQFVGRRPTVDGGQGAQKHLNSGCASSAGHLFNGVDVGFVKFHQVVDACQDHYSLGMVGEHVFPESGEHLKTGLATHADIQRVGIDALQGRSQQTGDAVPYEDGRGRGRFVAARCNQQRDKGKDSDSQNSLLGATNREIPPFSARQCVYNKARCNMFSLDSEVSGSP
jgi:hypothetical protein